MKLTLSMLGLLFLFKTAFADYLYNGLLTDSFNILSSSDVDRTIKVSPVTHKEVKGQFWQCFHFLKNKVRATCVGTGWYEGDGFAADLMLTFESSRNKHQYSLRRAIPIADCFEIIRDIGKLSKTVAAACVRGDYIDSESGQDGTTLYWIYDRYKTKTGCTSYFGSEDCLMPSQ